MIKKVGFCRPEYSPGGRRPDIVLIMSLKLLDGRVVRDALKKKLVERIDKLKKRGIAPALAIIQVGDRADTAAYIEAKKRFGADIGIEVRHVHLDDRVSTEEVISNIKRLNADRAIQGIIAQLPLPEGIKNDRNEIVNAIDPAKDADALTSKNELWPATARGVGELLDFYGIALKDKKVCVIGRSALVGIPVAALCRARGAAVTVCHSKTVDLKKETLAADIVISAVGRPKLITAEYVKPDQVIVDIGINEVKGNADTYGYKLNEELPKRNLVGDVDFEAVSRAIGPSGAITPVPGGVGPMTVLALFENLADLCQN